MKRLLIIQCLAWLPFLALGRADVEIIPLDLRGAIQPQVAAMADGQVFVTFGRGSEIFCAAGHSPRWRSLRSTNPL